MENGFYIEIRSLPQGFGRTEIPAEHDQARMAVGKVIMADGRDGYINLHRVQSGARAAFFRPWGRPDSPAAARIQVFPGPLAVAFLLGFRGGGQGGSG